MTDDIKIAIAALRAHCNREIGLINQSAHHPHPNADLIIPAIQFARVNELLKSCDRVFAAVDKQQVWMPMDNAPQDGTEIIVLIDSASVPIVRSAWWRDGYEYDEATDKELGIARKERDIGWWSYRHSVTQEKLEGYDIPKAWMPMPSTRDFV